MSVSSKEEVKRDSSIQNVEEPIENNRRTNSVPCAEHEEPHRLSYQEKRHSERIGEYPSKEIHVSIPKEELLIKQSDLTNVSINFRQSSEILLQWSNLTVKKESDNTTLLNSINGECTNNHSLAIMGPSGGGKTTLLNYLSSKMATNGLKKTGGIITLSVNNKNETKHLKEVSAFVTQDDILFEILTPRELFQFAADIKLVKKSKEEKNDVIEKLINTLGLNDCCDIRVGSALNKGI